jgi:hypothetical protein
VARSESEQCNLGGPTLARATGRGECLYGNEVALMREGVRCGLSSEDGSESMTLPERMALRCAGSTREGKGRVTVSRGTPNTLL